MPSFWDDFEAQGVVQDIMVVGVVVQGCFILTRNSICRNPFGFLENQMAVVLRIKTAFPLTFTCTNGVNVYVLSSWEKLDSAKNFVHA